MLKMSYTGCPGPSPAISAQFTLKMCVAARNHKKLLKTPILGVQGHSRSSTLTPIKSLSPQAAYLCLSATIFMLHKIIIGAE